MHRLLICLAVSIGFSCGQVRSPWHGTVMGYYHTPDGMPVSSIDFSSLTHVIHDHARPNADGSLDLTSNGVTTQASSDLITAAHAAGVKVLLCIADTWPSGDFPAALNNQSTLIANIVEIVTTRGYDGVDIDWENNLDWNKAGVFFPALKAALNAANPNFILTAATQPYGVASHWGAIAGDIDVIDCMTYELFWWGGRTTWHNAALYDGGAVNTFGTPLYSVDRIIKEYLAAGIPAAKLAVGIPFYGHKISGEIGTTTGGPTAPLEDFSDVQPNDQPLSYSAIIKLPEFHSVNMRRDNVAQVPYLGVYDPLSVSQDELLTYDDPQSVAGKVSYARTGGLAGVFIWALPYDYIPSNPVGGGQHPLLSAIKNVLTNLVISPSDITGSAWTKSGTGASAIATDTLRCATTGPTSLFETVSVATSTRYTAEITVQALGSLNGKAYLDLFGPEWSSVIGTQNISLSGTAAALSVTFNSGNNTKVIFSLDLNAATAGSTLKITNISLHSY